MSQHRLVDQALVIAEGRKFVSALLFPDFEAAEALKEYYGQSQMDTTEFFSQPKFQAKMDHWLKKVNQGLSHWEQVQKCQFVVHPLSIEEGDMTPKMNLRRTALYEKFDSIIDEFYAE